MGAVYSSNQCGLFVEDISAVLQAMQSTFSAGGLQAERSGRQNGGTGEVRGFGGRG